MSTLNLPQADQFPWDGRLSFIAISYVNVVFYKLFVRTWGLQCINIRYVFSPLVVFFKRQNAAPRRHCRRYWFPNRDTIGKSRQNAFEKDRASFPCISGWALVTGGTKLRLPEKHLHRSPRSLRTPSRMRHRRSHVAQSRHRTGKETIKIARNSLNTVEIQ